jgi:hypothetical protein
MRSNKSFLVLVALLVLQVGHAALAAPADPTPLPDEEYELKLHAAQQVSPLTSELAGEEVSMYDGSTTFSVTDADIPGNNALPVRIGRRLKIIDRHMEGNLPGFGDWDLDLPRIEGTFLADRGWKLEGAAPAGHGQSPPTTTSSTRPSAGGRPVPMPTASVPATRPAAGRSQPVATACRSSIHRRRRLSSLWRPAVTTAATT